MRRAEIRWRTVSSPLSRLPTSEGAGVRSPGSEGILPSAADSRAPGAVIPVMVSDGWKQQALDADIDGLFAVRGQDALAPDIGRSCHGFFSFSPSLLVGERAGERGLGGGEWRILILPFVYS